MWIDSHCHLGFRGLEEQEEEVLQRGRTAGIELFVNVESASTLASNHAAVELAERHPDVFTVIGTHPHDAKDMDPELMRQLRSLGTRPKVVAYGEAGLDYHYDNSPREVQKSVFRQWITAAQEDGLPLVIHTREAEDDTLRIFEEMGCRDQAVVIHCFTGTVSFARRCLDLGFYISIPGIVTFKNAGEVRDVARFVPEDRLLIETDSPFLAPIPKRGRTNEPSFLVHTGEFVADLRGVDVEQLARTTTANARRFFPKIETGRHA